MGLEPYLLSKRSRRKEWDIAEANDITSCIECGCCQATCPGYLPLLDWIRIGKQTVMGRIRAACDGQRAEEIARRQAAGAGRTPVGAARKYRRFRPADVPPHSGAGVPRRRTTLLKRTKYGK